MPEDVQVVLHGWASGDATGFVSYLMQADGVEPDPQTTSFSELLAFVTGRL